MEWFIAVLAVAALGVAAVAAAGGVGQMSKHPVYDTFRQDLPERQLTADDLRQLRFGIAWRGYAMDQVDDVIDRLIAEIAQRDATIAELRGEPPVPGASTGSAGEHPFPEASPGSAGEYPRPEASTSSAGEYPRPEPVEGSVGDSTYRDSRYPRPEPVEGSANEMPEVSRP